MSSDEEISTLYAKDLAPIEDAQNSRLLADENRRLVEENHRLVEMNRAVMNSLTQMNQRMEKMQDQISSMMSLKQENEKREADIRDLRKILMEVVQQNKKLKDGVHISELARQEIKEEFRNLRNLLSPNEPRAQTQLMPESEIRQKEAESNQHAVKEDSRNKENSFPIHQPLPWDRMMDDSDSDSGKYSSQQEDFPSYGDVEEVRVKMHHDWESSQDDGRNYFLGYKGDSSAAHGQQGQVTADFQQITKLVPEPNYLSRLPATQHKNQMTVRSLENGDKTSIREKECSVPQSLSPKSPRTKKEKVPIKNIGQQQRPQNMPASMSHYQNVKNQPMQVKDIANHGTSHIARKDQQIGYGCNETLRKSSKLKSRNLSPSTAVRMNLIIESLQGNGLPITQNDYGEIANQELVMENKLRSKIPVYQKKHDQYNDIKSKSTKEQADLTAEMLKRNSAKPPKTPNHGRNRDASTQTDRRFSTQTVRSKDTGDDVQDIFQENLTYEYANLPRKIARKYQQYEIKHIQGDSRYTENYMYDAGRQQAPQNRMEDVPPDISREESRVQMNHNQEPRPEREMCLSNNKEGTYKFQEQLLPENTCDQTGTIIDNEPVYPSLSAKYRNKLLDLGRYCSDKEMNRIFQKLQNQAPPTIASIETSTNMDGEPASFPLPAHLRNKVLDRERYSSDKEMNRICKKLQNQEKPIASNEMSTIQDQEKTSDESEANMDGEQASFSLPAHFRNKLLDRERYSSDKEMNRIFKKLQNQEKPIASNEMSTIQDQEKTSDETGANMDGEPASFSLPATFRNKLLDRERYLSDKEVNHIFQTLLNQEKLGRQTCINRELQPDYVSNPTSTQNKRSDGESYLSKDKEESNEFQKQQSPDKSDNQKNRDGEPAHSFLPAKCRNKLLDRERYLSDKEVNYIYQKLLNQEKSGNKNDTKMDPTTGMVQKPEVEENPSISKPKYGGEQRMYRESPQLSQENVQKMSVDQQRPRNTSLPESHSQTVSDALLRVQEPTNYNDPINYTEMVGNDQYHESKYDDEPLIASQISQGNVSPAEEITKNGIEWKNNPQLAEESRFVQNQFHQLETRGIYNSEYQISVDDLQEDLKNSAIIGKSKNTIRNSVDSSPQLVQARMDRSDQILPERFRSELSTENLLVKESFHRVPNKNREMFERNRDSGQHIGQSSHRIENNHSTEESGPAQKFQNPNREMGSEKQDTGLKNEGDGKDLNNSDAVVPRGEEADAFRESSSYTSGRGVIGDPIASSTPKQPRFMMEPIATSTPKTITEPLGKHGVPNRGQSSSDDSAVESDSGIDFDQKLSAALKILGTRVIGEIAFQLDRRIMENVFQPSPDDELMKNRFYGYTSQNMGALISKETLRDDGTRDLRKESCYRKRFEKLLNRLRDHGYNKMIHEDFVKKMVEKYGTINVAPSQKVVKMYGLEEPEVLEALLAETTANRVELVDTLVLLDCLRAMVSWNGGSLFKW